jgi:hypothetical protein
MTPTGTITNPTTDPLTCGSTRGVGSTSGRLEMTPHASFVSLPGVLRCKSDVYRMTFDAIRRQSRNLRRFHEQRS